MALSGAGCYHGLSREEKRLKTDYRRFWTRAASTGSAVTNCRLPDIETASTSRKTPGNCAGKGNGQDTNPESEGDPMMKVPIKTILRHIPAFIFRLWLWWPIRGVKMAQIALKLAIKAFRTLAERRRIAATNMIRPENPNQPIRTTAPERKEVPIKPTHCEEQP